VYNIIKCGEGRMTGKQMIKLYLRHGWIVVRIRGSHYTLNKGDKVERIPHHTRELKKGLETKFLKRLTEGED
jgi:predicted RNA binding protein YcfA (HicA-like mRNA interferase family)